MIIVFFPPESWSHLCLICSVFFACIYNSSHTSQHPTASLDNFPQGDSYQIIHWFYFSFLRPPSGDLPLPSPFAFWAHCKMLSSHSWNPPCLFPGPHSYFPGCRAFLFLVVQRMLLETLTFICVAYIFVHFHRQLCRNGICGLRECVQFSLILPSSTINVPTYYTLASNFQRKLKPSCSTFLPVLEVVSFKIWTILLFH